MVNDPNVQDLMESNKYKVKRSVIQNETFLRNEINQVQKLSNIAVYRARKHVIDFVLSDHKTDIKYPDSVARRVRDAGHSYDVISELIDTT